MKDILDFLAASPAFYVATTDENNRPKVRPFSFAMEWKGKLTFVTGTFKPTYHQLRNNPYVEICSFNPEAGEWMRISGSVALFKSEEANAKIFEIMPILKELYHTVDNPVMTCFSIEKGVAATYSFSSMNEPKKVQNLG